MPHLAHPLLLAALLATAPVAATNFFVDSFGDDSNDCRTHRTACATIQAAHDKSNGSDTIIVGDGTYRESLEITKPATRLISRRGAAATVIDATDQPGEPAVVALAKFVRIGQRNRGFTLRGGVDQPGVWIVGNRATVEGNRVEGGEHSRFPGFRVAAIDLNGDFITVRFNTTNGGIRAQPLREELIAIRRELITDNVLIRGGISLISTAEGSTNVVMNNQLHDGSISSVSTLPGENYFGGWRTNTNDRYIGNHTTGGAYFQGGRYLAERNTLSGIFTLDSTNSVIRRNSITARNRDEYGILAVQYTTNASITGNTITGFRWAMGLGSDSPFRPLVNNNILDSQECVLAFVSLGRVSPLVFRNNFFGSPGIPDLSCVEDGEEALQNGSLRLSPRNTPNPY